jgi:Ca2+-binding EF-hand superfamily protein
MRQLLGQDAYDTSTAMESLVALSVSADVTDPSPSESVVQLVFNEMDKNKDGIIDFEEFLTFWREQTMTTRGLIKEKFVKATKKISNSISAFLRVSKK